MNCIEYLSGLVDDLFFFEQTFDLELDVYELENTKTKESISLIPMSKDKINCLEKAMMLSIVHQHIQKNKNQYEGLAEEDQLIQAYKLLTNQYKQSEFYDTDSITFKYLFRTKIIKIAENIYFNNKGFSKEKFFKLTWVSEQSINNYHINTHNKSNEYIFETKNYFIKSFYQN